MSEPEKTLLLEVNARDVNAHFSMNHTPKNPRDGTLHSSTSLWANSIRFQSSAYGGVLAFEFSGINNSSGFRNFGHASGHELEVMLFGVNVDELSLASDVLNPDELKLQEGEFNSRTGLYEFDHSLTVPAFFRGTLLTLLTSASKEPNLQDS